MRSLLKKHFLIPSLLFFYQLEAFGQQLQTKDTCRTVTILKNKIKFTELVESVQKQTGWNIVYSNREINSEHIFSFRESVQSAGCIANQIADTFRVSYSVANSAIVFKRRTRAIPFQGTVVNAKGIALSGVIISDSSYRTNAVRSNKNGRFGFGYNIRGKWLILTHRNYETQRYQVKNNDTFQVVIKPIWKENLVTVEVTAPKNKSKAFRQSIAPDTLPSGIPGNISNQIMNKVPGVLIMNTSGAPGSPARLKLRGQTTIGLEAGSVNLPESNILFLVDSSIWDGPTVTTRRVSTMAGNAGSIRSNNPLETLNPADIESIEFLVNADATSNYGSLASNNIVSIQTKKGRPGASRNFTFTGAAGVAVVGTRMSLMNTENFIAARREALTNDGLPVDSTTAPELSYWSKSRSTNWYKYLTDRTAQLQRFNGSLRGGFGKKTGAYIGFGFNRETTVLPLKQYNKNFTLQANLYHAFNKNSSIQANVSTNYTTNRQPAFNPLTLSFLAPNAPYPTDEHGNLVYGEKGLNMLNILVALENLYEERRLVMRGNIRYDQKMLKKLSLITRLTVNTTALNEEAIFSIKASQSATTGSRETASSEKLTLIMENELNFCDTSNKQRIIHLQLSSTLLQELNAWATNNYEGYTSDEQLHNPSYAANIISAGRKSKYHYAGLSATANFLWHNMYSLNFTIRANGSSRFSASNQTGWSGAAGGYWSFIKSKWLARKLPFLDFGKLHISTGISLSDHVETGRNETNYAYAADGSRYDNIDPLRISQFANPHLTWERTYKNDVGIELGFRNFISMNLTWYRNLTTNQFISALYPRFTGLQLPFVINHNAEVLNTGLELGISYNKTSRSGNSSWSSKISATTHRNRVQRFPGLENSLYKNSICLNSSLSSQPVLLSKGVDPETGKYAFIDINRDGKISKPEDLVPGPDMDPLLFGGLQNKFSYKGWELEIFIDGMVQKALNPKLAAFQSLPGSFRPDLLTNLYSFYEDRWKKPGDISANQRLSASGNDGTLQTFGYHLSSENGLVDGSFARLRFVSLGYTFPQKLFKDLHLKQVMVYLRTQNLFLLTAYRDGDPTQLDPFALPSSRSVSAGLTLNF